MTRDLKTWFAEGEGLIAHWDPRGGGKHSVVPAGLQVLATAEEAHGEGSLVPAGAECPDPGVVLRAGTFMVPVHASPLRDRAGFSGRFVVTLEVHAPENRTAVLLLRDQSLLAPGLRAQGKAARFGIQDLAERLSAHLEKRLRASLSTAPWDGAGGVMETFRRDEVAVEVFRAPLFELGLTLRGVSGFSVESADLDEHRQRESELRRRAEEVRDRLEFIDLWKREEMGEALAREEVEKLAEHLRKEGMLRELDVAHRVAVERIEKQRNEAAERGKLRRMLERERIATESEIDEERLQYEIEKAQRLHEVLQKHGLLAVAGQLGDSPEHARLLELLVEREMTPEQLAARSATASTRPEEQARWEELENRLEALSVQLHVGNSTLARHAENLPTIAEIWLAAGVSLYRLTGVAAVSRGMPTPVLPPDDIGFLRSVSVVGQPGATSVLVGAQAGVGVYRPQGSHWGVYRYRPAPQGRGGANSVALASGRVLASHSELGLHAWTEGATLEAAAASVQQRISEPPTRGVQVGTDGVVYLSRGAEVLSLRGVTNEMHSLGSLSDSVTALCHDRGELIAGTRDGQLHRWEGGSRWTPLPFRSSGPVFCISAVGGDTPIRWIVGARQAAVHVLDRQGHLLEEYRTRYPIRWVAAGREGVLGVDRFGQELLVWNWSDPAAPQRRIRVPAQIQSLDVERGDSC